VRDIDDTHALAPKPIDLANERLGLGGRKSRRRFIKDEHIRFAEERERDESALELSARKMADRRLGDTLARADTALGTVEALRLDLKPVLDNSAAITAQVNASLPLFLDCDHNVDCVFNRYVGASRGIERAALNFGQMTQDQRDALPKMLLTWQQIGADVSGTAGNLNRLTKPHWYDRLLGYGLNAAVIYRNLNPITSLTVTGAQILSARP